MNLTTVVFDIGAVLVDWKPQLAWLDELGSAEVVEDFMVRTDFRALNTRADAGERFADLAKEVSDPEDQRRVADYVQNYPKTVEDVVPGTWEILDRLRANGTPLHAITNWSAETWPRGLISQPRLGEVFGTIVISGVEKIAKPDARIFHILCDKAGVVPEECVFVDDSPRNVDGARAVGMDAIHFTDAQALETELQSRGLL